MWEESGLADVLPIHSLKKFGFPICKFLCLVGLEISSYQEIENLSVSIKLESERSLWTFGDSYISEPSGT